MTAGSRTLLASAMVGGAFGALDGALAWWDVHHRWPHPVLETLGAVCAAALVYSVAWAGFGLVLHLLLGLDRTRVLLLTVSMGVFVELYWRTRPVLFPGRSALSPERLIVALGLLLLGLAAGKVLVTQVRRAPLGARPLHALALLMLLGGAASLVTASVEDDERGRIGERNEDLPNVLLVIVDALRADVLAPYGGERVSTPHFDRLAAGGVTLEQARVQAPTTWPSFGSILTGKYPLRHGLVSMRPGLALPDSVTLASYLKTARRLDGRQLEGRDWASAAFMTGALTNGSRLLQGFDQTSELLDGNDLVDLSSAWSQLRAELPFFRVLNKVRQRVDGDLVLTTALEWIEEHRDRRFMALIHLYATHTPYDPGPVFREVYLDPEYEGPIDTFYPHHRRSIESGEYVPTPMDRQRIRDLYDACVAEVDSQVGRLLDALERLDLAQDTLLIVTSDHGEELGDHGLWEHNWMYETNLHVPCFLSWPGVLPGGRRVAGPVESVDYLPTICDLLDLPAPGAAGPYGEIDGRSLVRLLEPLRAGMDPDGPERGEPETGRPVFAINTVFASVEEQGWKLILPLDPVASGTRRAGPSMGASTLPPSKVAGRRLFHLRVDPEERQDLARSGDPLVRERMQRLRSLLEEWFQRQPLQRSDIRRDARDDDDLEILRRLGYVDDSGDR